MATQIGKGHIFGLSGVTLTQAGGSAAKMNVQAIAYTHQSQIDEISGQDGEFNSLIGFREKVDAEVTVIPEGATTTEARAGAALPAFPTGWTIAGAPVIVCGSFADVLNAATWVYKGGGKINGVSDGKWTMTLSLTRYPGITVMTAVA